MVIAGALLLSCATAAHAQLPSASTAALGMADNFTAIARGYAAVAWNPALLGMAGNPRASFTIAPVRAVAGLDPITLGDLGDYSGESVPSSVREEWLTLIEQEGSEQGTAGGDASYFAAQIGKFGVQLASSFRAISNISPGAAELLLFGNYGRTGQLREFDLDGSNLKAYAASTLAASYGEAVGTQRTDARMSAGVTVKYTVGHALLFGEDRGTAFTSDASAEINFPVVATRTSDLQSAAGRGIGIDLGFAMMRGAWTFALTAQNVINTFKWDEDELVFRAGLASFDTDNNQSDFEEREFSSAPAHLQEFVDDARFVPVIAAGVGFVATSHVTISGDVRTRVGTTTLDYGPKLHIGVGAEARWVPALPLRAGVALIEGGYQLAGGIGLAIGRASVSASIAHRNTDLGIDTIGMLTLLSGSWPK